MTAVDHDSSTIYTEQDVNDNGFLRIVCSFQYIGGNESRPVNVEWFSPSGVAVPAVPLKTVVSVLEGNADTESREFFAVRQQGQQSAIMYILGDRLAEYQGNYTCKATSQYYNKSAILRQVQVMSEPGEC